MSSRLRSYLSVGVLVLAAAFIVRAAEPTTKPAKTSKTKLVKPWSDLNSLSDEQKIKISTIHQDALAQIKVIKDKEEADIRALLSDAQKAELKKLEDEDKAASKSKKSDKMKDKSESPTEDKD